jgi:hypothetical protein
MFGKNATLRVFSLDSVPESAAIPIAEASKTTPIAAKIALPIFIKQRYI